MTCRKLSRLLIVGSILLAPGMAAASVWSRLSFSVAPTSVLSLSGDFNDAATMKDMVIPGAGLGLVLRLQVHPESVSRRRLFL